MPHRHLFTLCSAVSLLLFAAVCAMWLRGTFRSDDVEWRTVDHRRRSFTTYYFDLSNGSVFAHRTRVSGLDEERFSGTLAYFEPGWQHQTHAASINTGKREVAGPVGAGERRWSAFGLAYIRRRLGPPAYLVTTRSDAVLVPMWVLATALGAPAAFAMLRLWRHRRKSPGLCQTCGYDLRASPGRCPECGAAAGGAGS